MEYLVSILTRKTVIDLIYLVGCNYNYNSPLKNRVRLNLGNYTDTELAAIWFKNFGEVVIVGDSKFHHLIGWQIATSYRQAKLLIRQWKKSQKD